ncbi:hypothetical protein [Rhodovulum sulfidophilum]|uniref:Uncharacterized protein n=1 Tax=Rhodovulum sulfidophilum TaxID=35806 RepID=A0ABS1RZT2_RHOSU|nr:hypothetical protein [Rhodovulum sulfidophilum]MBL3611032.1 hypothetical protein [Rhodovulum sulfidophilum]MCE8455314.1 hypothetical protein [Rhodovulum sulfidophilum]
MNARFLRAKAKPATSAEVIADLIEIERLIRIVCTREGNPLTLRAADELAKTHRRIRNLRYRIESEAGL